MAPKKRTDRAVGIALKAIRNERGFTTDEVADQTGITTRTLSRYENGVTSPPVENLYSLASTYQVSPQDLLTTADTIRSATTTAIDVVKREDSK